MSELKDKAVSCPDFMGQLNCVSGNDFNFVKPMAKRFEIAA